MVLSEDEKLKKHSANMRAYRKEINRKADEGDKKAQAVKKNNQKVKNFSVSKNFIKSDANISDLGKIKGYIEERENTLSTNKNSNLNCKFIDYKKDKKGNYTINIEVDGKKAYFFIQGYDNLKNFLDYPLRSRVSRQDVEYSIPYIIKELMLLTDITQHSGFKWNTEKE